MQKGTTCGLLAVNHCLAHAGVEQLKLKEFQEYAEGGVYAEGDSDDSGLRRNLARLHLDFERVEGNAHKNLVRQDEDKPDEVVMFSRVRA